MRLLILLITPYIIIWLLTRSRRAFRWILLTALLTIQLFSLLPLLIVWIVVMRQPTATSMALAGIYRSYTVTNSQLHGLNGWEGVDIKAGCGQPIYAPFAGTVTYNGLDGYSHQGIYKQATMLTIENDYLEMTLLHGDYLPQVGSQVQKGQMIGTENTHGWSTGCHSHVILKDNGRLVNYLEWSQSNTVLAKINNVPAVTADYPLRISWYDPSKCYDANGNIIKNTNCDSDPTTMASGDKVVSWIGGRGGVYAAACPRSNGWHHGKRFELDGVVYECRDTGGWINCYQPGVFDPALRRQADSSYCWVDLLNNSSYGYGNLAYNWSMVR